MSLLCYYFHVHQKTRIFIFMLHIIPSCFQQWSQLFEWKQVSSFWERREKTVRQTAKELLFLCLNMLFISEILTIRSSAQVKSLFAPLVVHRVYELKLKGQVEFFLLIQIPFPSGINPELLLSIIVWDSFGPRPGWTFLSPSLRFLLAPSPVSSTSPAVLCTGLSKLHNGRDILILWRTSSFVHALVPHAQLYLKFLHKNGYGRLPCSHTGTRER